MASPGTKLTALFVLTLFVVLHAEVDQNCPYSSSAAMTTSCHSQSGKTWCVAKPSTDAAALRANVEFACSESDCSAIQGTSGCTHSDSMVSRASVAMNAYYQAKGRNYWNCCFNGTGLITLTDPSLGTCKYT